MTEKNLAIIIGSSEYIQKEDNLDSVKNDIQLISEILKLSKKYHEILILLDNKNSSDIKSSLSTFINKYKKEKIHEILFYFSGHGMRKTNKENDELYLKLYDTANDKLASTALSNSEVDNYLRELNPNVAVKILDCCNSGTQYLKDANTPFFNKLETQAKEKFSDLIFISSSKSDEPSHALEDYSFFTKALAVSITHFSQENIIYYKDLISSIADYSQSNYFPEPQTTMQGSFLHPFITYNEDIKTYLIENIKLNSKSILENSFNEQVDLPQQEAEKSGLIELASLVKEKSSMYSQKEKILSFIASLQKHLLDIQNFSDFQYFFDIEFQTNIDDIPNPESLGEWVDKNQHKDYFCEPIFTEKKYTVKEYVPAPKKIKKINDNLSFLRSMALSGLGNYEEVEEVLEEVTKYKSVLTGFNITCSLETNEVTNISKNISILLKPKSNYLFLRSYKIFLIIIFSFKEVAVFSKIHTLKHKDWDQFKEIDKTKWFVKESYLNLIDQEALGNQVIDSIRQKIDASIKSQLSNQKEGDKNDPS